jgi:hypothetical protein
MIYPSPFPVISGGFLRHSERSEESIFLPAFCLFILNLLKGINLKGIKMDASLRSA